MSETFPHLQAFELDKLIGTPYVLGETDCIWMTLTVLKSLGIDAPPLNPDWYQMPPIRWARDLLAWGNRIDEPVYDGDVLVAPYPAGFCVVWRGGLFHICRERNAVSWSPLTLLNGNFSLMSGASSRPWVLRSKSIGKSFNG